MVLVGTALSDTMDDHDCGWVADAESFAAVAIVESISETMFPETY